MNTIMVVDNEKSMCEFLTIMLDKEGYKVKTARSGEDAVALIKDKENDFDVVITDIKMPKSSGIDVLEAVNKLSPNTPVVMMTAYASAETAVTAMKKGAYDYISKPFKIEELQHILRNALEKKKLSEENRMLKTALRGQFQFDNIIGRSPSIQKVFDYIQKVADSGATILITGESGTGKEMVAKSIHFNGVRKNFPFVSVNCGAVPENLLESELFGHEKGAFTSADSTKIGLMESANKGTFFLDEISEAPLTIQVKLLRAIQEKEFTRVGGTQPIKVDIRFIAATNRDLAERVKENLFREDLFYRLNVISIPLPPLRERRQDIPLLADYFLKKYNDQHHRSEIIKGVDPEAMKVLENYHWPGNVRELENVIERAVVLEPDNMIHASSLPDEVFGKSPQQLEYVPSVEENPLDLEKTLDQIERKILEGALKKSNGIINKAAKHLNLSFRSMRYRVQKHQLKGKASDNEK